MSTNRKMKLNETADKLDETAANSNSKESSTHSGTESSINQTSDNINIALSGAKEDSKFTIQQVASIVTKLMNKSSLKVTPDSANALTSINKPFCNTKILPKPPSCGISSQTFPKRNVQGCGTFVKEKNNTSQKPPLIEEIPLSDINIQLKRPSLSLSKHDVFLEDSLEILAGSDPAVVVKPAGLAKTNNTIPNLSFNEERPRLMIPVQNDNIITNITLLSSSESDSTVRCFGQHRMTQIGQPELNLWTREPNNLYLNCESFCCTSYRICCKFLVVFITVVAILYSVRLLIEGSNTAARANLNDTTVENIMVKIFTKNYTE